MPDPHSSSPGYLDTARLRLVAANARLVSLDLEGPEALAAELGAAVPPAWPPRLYDRPAMGYALRQLADPAERGWSIWYLILQPPEVREVIGICGFKGRPDGKGSVEIGYSLLSRYQGRGLASEAVRGLIGWAFAHPAVREVCAETLPYLRESIRVLKACGFEPAGAGSERGVVRFALTRAGLR